MIDTRSAAGFVVYPNSKWKACAIRHFMCGCLQSTHSAPAPCELKARFSKNFPKIGSGREFLKEEHTKPPK